MTFGQSISHCFSNYANFNGRASRSEFWYFYLFNLIIVGIPVFIGTTLMISGTTITEDGTESSMSAVGVFGLILMLFGVLISLAIIIPNLAVGCRRLHDRGTSGWLLLLHLVPCGGIVLLIFWLLESQGPNAYGDGPARA